MSRYYAGVGSRRIPHHCISYVQTIATTAEEHGIWLRSGAAPGTDKMFESSIVNKSNSQIFLPWENFNGSDSPLFCNTPELNSQADAIAERYHPAYNKLSRESKLLMRRNTFQDLGWDLKSPSLFVACWTPDGAVVGGTAQAIRIAKAYNIPVFNFGKNPDKVIKECIAFMSMC